MEDEYLNSCRRRVVQAFTWLEKARKLQREAIRFFGSEEPELLGMIEEVIARRQKILNDADHYLVDYLNKQAAIEQAVRE